MSHDKLAELINAYLDGEADAREREYVEREIARDETARAMLEDLRRVREMTATLPRQSAPDALAGDVLRLLERQALLGVVDEAPYVAQSSWRPIRAMLSIAAAMVILVTGGWWYMRPANLGGDHNDNKLAMVTTEKDASSVEKETSRPGDARSTRSRASRSLKRATEPADSAAPMTVGGSDKLAIERKDNPKLEESVARLVVKTHTEQRLAAGEKLDFLPTHAFENEPIRLRLALHDAAQAASAREAFKLQLASQGLVDADAMTVRTQATKLRGQSFYYQGKAGTNFQADNQSQMLVRIPVGQMKTLLNNISIEGVVDKDVALSAGPIVVQGLARAQSSVSYFGQTTPHTAKFDTDLGVSSSAHDTKKTITSDQASEAQVDIFAEMMKAVGLSEDMLSFNKSAPLENAQPTMPSPGKGRREVSGVAKNVGDDSLDAKTSTSGDRDEDDNSMAHRSTPLVERREAALEKSRVRRSPTVGRDAMADKVNPASKAAVTHGKGAEQQYITLVVEFVAPPKHSPPRTKPSASAKSSPAKPVDAQPKKSDHPQQ